MRTTTATRLVHLTFTGLAEICSIDKKFIRTERVFHFMTATANQSTVTNSRPCGSSLTSDRAKEHSQVSLLNPARACGGFTALQRIRGAQQLVRIYGCMGDVACWGWAAAHRRGLRHDAIGAVLVRAQRPEHAAAPLVKICARGGGLASLGCPTANPAIPQRAQLRLPPRWPAVAAALRAPLLILVPSPARNQDTSEPKNALGLASYRTLELAFEGLDATVAEAPALAEHPTDTPAFALAFHKI